MSFLLDTEVVRELRKPVESCHPGVRRWTEGVGPQLLHLSVLSVMELEQWVAGLAARSPAQGEAAARWLASQLLPAFEHRILAIDLRIIRHAATLAVAGHPEGDCVLAATAVVHGMSLVTRDVEAFSVLGVAAIDPWV